jgi:hypothetical protein
MFDYGHIEPLKIISIVFHPIFVPLPAGIVTLLLAGYPFDEAVRWVGFSVIVIVGPLALWAAYMLSTNQDMNIRENRYPIYFVLGASTLALLVVFYLIDAPDILLATMYASAGAGLVGGLLNVRIKISLHTGVWAGAAVILGHFSLIFGAFAAIITVVVAATRLRMGRHTLSEVALAAVLPVGSALISFWLLGIG